jgi:WD40 repeat protein
MLRKCVFRPLSNASGLTSSAYLLSVDQQISHFDIAKKSLIATFGMKQVNWQSLEAVWFRDGRRAATGGRNGEVVIWDLSTHMPLMTLMGNSTIVKSIALSPDERRLATCGWDGKVRVWNTDSGSLAKSWQLGPPKGIVFQVAFSPDGRYLATVNGNGTAYILRVDGIGAKSASADATSEGN